MNRLTLEAELHKEGYTVLTVSNAVSGLECLKESCIDVAITDLRMPGIMDGLAFRREAKTLCPDLRVIVMIPYGSAETAVTAMLEGASVYLFKPFQFQELSLKLTRLM